MEPLLGTQAYLTFTVSVERMRRLSKGNSQGDSFSLVMDEASPRRTSTDCNAGKVEVALGVHGYFGGLFIPFDWRGKSKGLKLVNESDFESRVFYGPDTIYCRTTTTTTPDSESAPPALLVTTTTTSRGRVTQQGCQCRGLRNHAGDLRYAASCGSSAMVNKVEPVGRCQDTRTHRAQLLAAIRMVSRVSGASWRTKRVSRPTGAIVPRSQSRDARASNRGHGREKFAPHTVVTTVSRGPGARWRVGLASSIIGATAAQLQHQARPSQRPRPRRLPPQHSQPRL